jgi:cysteine-rich repeat protein
MLRRAWFVLGALLVSVTLPACTSSVVENVGGQSSTSGGTGGSTASCGDGQLDPGEACDDGNPLAGDGCSADCHVEPGFTCTGSPSTCATTCGDGVAGGTEQCDDGNATPGDGCSADCHVELGWGCTGEPAVCATVCGDGHLLGAEACDDGNLSGGDGCSATCAVEPGWACAGSPSVCTPSCGDGIVSGAEQCDDGNTQSGDGCSAACAVEVGWQCSGAGPGSCAAVCGDGLQVGAEQCDDGNTQSGDGCSATCTPEAGFVCGDGVKVVGEECDDGNTVAGDCCSPTCQVEAGCEVEVNDTLATANAFAAVAVAGKVKGFIQPGTDKDVFSVVVPPGAKGNLHAVVLDGFLGKTCASNQLDSFLTIYDQNGATLGTDDDSGDGFCSQLSLNTLSPGTFYVEVRKSNFGGPTVTFDYTLQIDLQLAICGNGIKESGEACDDGNLANGDGCSSQCLLESTLAEVEPNDSFGQADANAAAVPALLFTGDALIAGSIGTPTDKDTFKLTLAAPTVIRFETFDLSLDDCATSTKTKLTVFNSAFLQVATDTTSGIASCSAIVYPLPAGTFYVQVASAGTGTVPGYYLQLKTQADAGAEAEPNDALGTATTFTGTDAAMSADHTLNADADFYAVTVPAGKSIRAELIEGPGGAKACDGGGIDSRLTLFDAATTQLADDDDSGRGFCSMIDGTGSAPLHAGAHGLAAGTYYLRVASSMFAMNGPQGQFTYRLQVTVR